MQSKNYERAQTIVQLDKYNATKTEFYADLAELVKQYYSAEGITAEAYYDDGLKVVITLSVKKVKQIKRVLA